MSAPKLELVRVKKEFLDGSVAAVDGVDLVVEEGQTLALLGPSGCGKSTTLNMIVGLEYPTSGDIRIDGKSVLAVPAGRRDVGLVFQDYAVFTSMSVKENLAFGLVVRGMRKDEVDRAVGEIADLLDLTPILKSRTRDLGGSELQRVAIGRTLVTRPAILLLDEPLSNLEAAARLATRKELRRLQKEVGLTIIYVTHDQVEALSLADRIAVMSAGKVMQIERATLICSRPENVFVAGFMGSPPMNLLRGHLARSGRDVVFRKDGFTIPVLQPSETPDAREMPVVLGIRPEDMRLGRAEAEGLAARVLLVEPRGADAVVTVLVGGETLKVITDAQDRPEEGSEATMTVDPGAFVLFGGETNCRLSLFERAA